MCLTRCLMHAPQGPELALQSSVALTFTRVSLHASTPSFLYLFIYLFIVLISVRGRRQSRGDGEGSKGRKAAGAWCYQMAAAWAVFSTRRWEEMVVLWRSLFYEACRPLPHLFLVVVVFPHQTPSQSFFSPPSHGGAADQPFYKVTNSKKSSRKTE